MRVKQVSNILQGEGTRDAYSVCPENSRREYPLSHPILYTIFAPDAIYLLVMNLCNFRFNRRI